MGSARARPRLPGREARLPLVRVALDPAGLVPGPEAEAAHRDGRLHGRRRRQLDRPGARRRRREALSRQAAAARRQLRDAGADADRRDAVRRGGCRRLADLGAVARRAADRAGLLEDPVGRLAVLLPPRPVDARARRGPARRGHRRLPHGPRPVARVQGSGSRSASRSCATGHGSCGASSFRRRSRGGSGSAACTSS